VTIRHIAFDLDGTLVDTHDQIVESILGCLPESDRSGRTRAKIKSQANASPRVILKQFGISGLDRYWQNHAKMVAYSRLFFEDTGSIMRELRRRDVSVSLLTSLPARPAERLIDAAGLRRFFSLIDTFASRPYRKPSPKLVAMHLSDCGVDCDEAAYVGDSAGDMQMASRAGVHAWAAGWSRVGSSDLKSAGAERILASLRDILDLATG
jgi:phosphoglycolate phosphatase